MEARHTEPPRRSARRQHAATHPTARARRRARWIGAAVVLTVVSTVVCGFFLRSDVDEELRCAEDAMLGVLSGMPGAPAEMKRCLARARRRGLLDYRPAWLSALGYHVHSVQKGCDPRNGGPLRRGACLLRNGRYGDAARLYAGRLPDPSGPYLAAVARRLQRRARQTHAHHNALEGANP
jgi:hypothetical protein